MDFIMVFEYTYHKEDYLSAMTLQKANSRESGWMLQLCGMAVVSCAIYISVSTIRGTLFVDDVFSYGVALASLVAQLLPHDNRFIPSLLFEYRRKTGKIPPGILGRHVLEVREDALIFRHGVGEHAMRYSNLLRVNYNQGTVLFYTGTGTVEAVPLRAFGAPDERGEVLAIIEDRVKESRSAQKKPALMEPYRDTGLHTVEYALSHEDFFRCNSAYLRHVRRRGAPKPMTLFWVAAILIIAAGSVKGLALSFGGLAPPMGIVIAYYVAGLLACAVGTVLLIRPGWLMSWGLRQRLRIGQYPYGFFDARRLQWCGEWLAFQYGLIGSKILWNDFTDVFMDGEYIYLYQGETLVLFIPRSALGEKEPDFPVTKST